ncbi:MAG: hypothetical protein KJ634_11515 [Gammaproteobacteria bacterium]|nr:hypothetical protein [Gammaproteobacteria bacterium]MBU1416243.1 hypothetical protein [Gammaproteobacteria bacterium]
MKFTVTKIDAAVDQMDWAIKLLLDHQAYIPAITLAGAAEEIVGELLGDESAFSQLKKKFCAQYNLPVNVVSQAHLNRAKNWLKHWRDLKDNEQTEIELEEEAIQYIVRALINLVTHDRSLPSEGPRFLDWLAKRQ